MNETMLAQSGTDNVEELNIWEYSGVVLMYVACVQVSEDSIECEDWLSLRKRRTVVFVIITTLIGNKWM